MLSGRKIASLLCALLLSGCVEQETVVKDFTREELMCRHCQRTNPNPEFQVLMKKVQRIRDKIGPLVIASGYRCPDHPIEKAKEKPGWHTIAAVDIVAKEGVKRSQIVSYAVEEGIYGIGIYDGHVHLDLRPEGERYMWID